MKDKLSDKLKSKQEIKKVVDSVSDKLVLKLENEGVRIKLGTKFFDKYLNYILDGSMTIEQVVIIIQEIYILRKARLKRDIEKSNKPRP